MFPIREAFITKNRPYQKLNAIGIVLHETANPGASDEDHYSYFNKNNVGASAHAFIDEDSITQLIPWNEVAWHGGKTANHKFIGIEMCHNDDEAKFDIIYGQTVELFAWIFINILKTKTITKNNLMSHAEVSTKWGETDHMDPITYFNRHQESIDKFRSDVQNKINEMSYTPKYFTDERSISEWASKQVFKLKELGIVHGDNFNNFLPSQNITREAFATILFGYLKTTGKIKEGGKISMFKDDAKISEWAKISVVALSDDKVGIIKGDNLGNFKPQDKITREAAAVLIYNALKFQGAIKE